MESELLALKVEIAELRDTVRLLTERVESLESRESGSGVYLDGIAEGYRDFIKKELGGK